MPSLKKYDNFLRTDMGYSIATVEGYIIKLKTMTRTALAQGTIRYNPFASFIPEKALRKHRHLTMDELQRLMRTPVPNGFLCLVRDMFIFSTFTGISYIDMCNLNTSNLSKDGKGNLWIKLKRQKTKSECAIRLLDIPRRILEKYEGERTGDRLFNMPCRSALTNNMPKLAKLCGIERRLTYHMARHNFGTLITLSQGVSVGNRMPDDGTQEHAHHANLFPTYPPESGRGCKEADPAHREQVPYAGVEQRQGEH